MFEFRVAMRICLSIASILFASAAGCQPSKVPDAIVVAQISDDVGERAGAEFALVDLASNWPLGRPIKLIQLAPRADGSDFEAQVIRLSQLNRPAAIFGGRTPAEAQGLARGLSTELVLGFTLADSDGIPFQPNLFYSKVRKVAGETESVQPPAHADLIKRYRDKFGTGPVDTFFQSYASMEIFAEALRRAGVASHTRAREELLKKDKPFETVLGPVTFEANQSIRIKDTKIVPSP